MKFHTLIPICSGVVVALGILGCTHNQEASKPELERFMESGGPTTIGTIRRVTSGPPIDSNWGDDYIFGLNSQFFNNRNDIYAQVTIERQSGFESQEYYWNSKGLHKRIESKDDWLYIPETTGAPRGFRLSENALPRPITLGMAGEKIVDEIKQGSTPSTSTEAVKLEYLRDEFETEKIVSRATEKPIADVPNLPAPRSASKPKNIEDNYTPMEDVRKVDGNFVVGCVRYNPQRKNGDYSWRIRPIGGSKWKTIVRHFDADYLNRVLPDVLKGTYRPYIRESYIKIWKDGSLIFPVHTTIKNQRYIVDATFLVLQPINGKPQLLNWNVHHVPEIAPDSGNQPIAKNWVPIGNKAVSSNPSDTKSRRILFAVDGTNDSIIYLQGGQLWAIDMSKVRY